MTVKYQKDRWIGIAPVLQLFGHHLVDDLGDASREELLVGLGLHLVGVLPDVHLMLLHLGPIAISGV